MDSWIRKIFFQQAYALLLLGARFRTKRDQGKLALETTLDIRRFFSFLFFSDSVLSFFSLRYALESASEIQKT